MKTTLTIIAALALAGCDLTPAQLATVAKVKQDISAAALNLASDYIRAQFDLGPNW